MVVKDWSVEAMTGYKPLTTFYSDFSVADAFGPDAIKDTYKRGIETAEALGYKELTEFVMVLNWKIWEHAESNRRIAELYDELWGKAEEYICETLKGEELQYYYRTVD